MTTWHCKACGKAYEGVVETPPTFTPEEVEKRRATYEVRYQLWQKTGGGETISASLDKAERAYFETMAKPRELMPPGLTTELVYHPCRYVIVCAGGCKMEVIG